MTAAIDYLNAITNATIQARSSEFETLIDMVKPEVSLKAYGKLYQQQIADLVAHDILTEAAEASDPSGGQAGGNAVSEIVVGPRRIKYGSQSSSRNVDPRSDEGLNRTMYGRRFLRRRSECSIGFFSTGTCP
jgi:hypothetical protein